MLANQMFPAVLGIFMVVLVQGLGMSPLLWSLIFFLPKLIDAITDPYGIYIRPYHLSMGERRPYVFIGAIISRFSFVMMWQLSAENLRCIILLFFFGLCFWIDMTIFSVPMWQWVMK